MSMIRLPSGACTSATHSSSQHLWDAGHGEASSQSEKRKTLHVPGSTSALPLGLILTSMATVRYRRL